MTVFG